MSWAAASLLVCWASLTLSESPISRNGPATVGQSHRCHHYGETTEIRRLDVD